MHRYVHRHHVALGIFHRARRQGIGLVQQINFVQYQQTWDVLRIDLADMQINDKIENFRFGDYKITNYEMEGSAIAGLSKLMGHKAMTVCCIIANRRVEAANTNYNPYIEKLVQTVLDRI